MSLSCRRSLCCELMASCSQVAALCRQFQSAKRHSAADATQELHAADTTALEVGLKLYMPGIKAWGCCAYRSIPAAGQCACSGAATGGHQAKHCQRAQGHPSGRVLLAVMGLRPAARQLRAVCPWFCRCRPCWRPPAVRCSTCSISRHTCPPTCQHLSQAASRGSGEQMQRMLCHSLRCLRAKRTAPPLCQPLRPQTRGNARRPPEGQAALCTGCAGQRVCQHNLRQPG